MPAARPRVSAIARLSLYNRKRSTYVLSRRLIPCGFDPESSRTPTDRLSVFWSECRGALASVFIILVRIPALSTTKLEELVGTLQGAAVALLFVILALMINLTYMVHRASAPATGDSAARQPAA